MKKAVACALDFFSEVTATDASDMIEAPSIKVHQLIPLQREDFFK